MKFKRGYVYSILKIVCVVIFRMLMRIISDTKIAGLWSLAPYIF